MQTCSRWSIEANYLGEVIHSPVRLLTEAIRPRAPRQASLPEYRPEWTRLPRLGSFDTIPVHDWSFQVTPSGYAIFCLF